MKILMLTPYLPYPPSQGGQIRSYNLLKHLGKKHEIWLVALIKSEEDKQYVSFLKPFCKKIFECKRSSSPWTIKNVLKSIFGPLPFLIVRNFSSEARKIIQNLLKYESFDLIHAETFYIMPHIPKTNIPILLVEQTIEYKVYQHFVDNMKIPLLPYLLNIDILKLKYWEKTYWKKANRVGVVSKDDAIKIHSLLPSLKIEVIPNAAGDDLLDLYKKSKKIPKNPVFLYLGHYLWLQNIEAATILAKKVFPLIKKEFATAKCIIAGQHAEKKIAHLKKYDVEIVEYSDKDSEIVKNLYRKATIFIAPIEGPGGTRLKILGAMAAGIPVISSPTGVSGLNVIDNKNVLIAKSHKEFAKKAKLILSSTKLFNKIRQNARVLIDSKYTYKKVATKLEEVYKDMIQKNTKI